MKIPESLHLPLVIKQAEDESDEDKYEVFHSNPNKEYWSIVMHNKDYYNYAPSKEQATYMVKAANMFPEAVELLKYFVQRVEEGSIRSNTTYAKYKDFLTKLEEDENT